ncbi:MAG: hypothetical protein KKA70_01240 [Proteobacteria bacterium]|nr:hypothetical protein [Pseudomonadota bacterium]MBU1714714.1 hypothetical protein [Pseudomonadota bacterium]
MKPAKLFLLSTTLLGATLYLSSVAAGENITPKALFEKKCQACHELDVPKSQKLDKNGWDGIMSWMTSMGGANISDDEALIIRDYLAENYCP